MGFRQLSLPKTRFGQSRPQTPTIYQPDLVIARHGPKCKAKSTRKSSMIEIIRICILKASRFSITVLPGPAMIPPNGSDTTPFREQFDFRKS
jgi:hypothetical protein